MDMNPKFKVIIAGSRHFEDFPLLVEKCDAILRQKIKTHDVIIISGTANGADKLGERYASMRGLAINRFPAKWDEFGKMAGMMRNAEMLDNADSAIVFWDGSSRGSQHMINITRRSGKPLRVIMI